MHLRFLYSTNSWTKVKDYILKWCYCNSIGSCTFQWIYYFPGADDGNVTRKLHSFVARSSTKYKSVHLTSALLDASFHDATCKQCLMPGYKVVHVPLHIAYMAHLRMNDRPKECQYEHINPHLPNVQQLTVILFVFFEYSEVNV